MIKLGFLVLTMGLTLTSCVTIEDRISIVNATAIDELDCDDQEIMIGDLGRRRFIAQCGRQRATYMVNCPKGPSTCLIRRMR